MTIALTPRQQQVLDLLRQGMSVSAISLLLGIGEGTVYHHLEKAERKGHDVPRFQVGTQRNRAADERRHAEHTRDVMEYGVHHHLVKSKWWYIGKRRSRLCGTDACWRLKIKGLRPEHVEGAG